MTISTQDSKVNYQGNGQTTVFQIPFPFLENNQIYVQKKDAEGNLINYTYATDYTVNGAGEENGGSVTLNVAPEQGSTISIYRDVPLTQEVDYRENEIFPAETHEEALDKLTMEVQQLQEQLDRSIKVDRFSDVDLDIFVNAIERVYDSTDNIDTVANNINDVNTVSGNIANVNTTATNIVAIQYAPTAATNAANSATASATSAQAAQDTLNDVKGLIATPIGTIFMSIYVDESLDIARQLNGQLISSTKFTGFRSWLNTVQIASPNLFTTETNWQAEKTNSKLGQCGKFVVDDTAGTIRLPCVVNAQGLADLALIGGIKSESLPNITGSVTAWNDSDSQRTDFGIIGGKVTGAFTRRPGYRNMAVNPTSITADNKASSTMLGFNASLSSSTYQNNASVQQEAIQYPYYIQVATGVEETLPAIREYQINTPFFFGQSMYSDVAPDNASWLVSNGQYNAKSVYPDYYDWLLGLYNNPTESNVVKVGSVTDNNGVLSGFSSANNALLPVTFSPANNPWEIVIKFKTPQTFSEQGLISKTHKNGMNYGLRIAFTSNGAVYYLIGSSYNTFICEGVGVQVLNADTNYYVKFEFTGEAYKAYISTNAETWTEDFSFSTTTPIESFDEPTYLGDNRNKNIPFAGSIDLNESYININGQRWWNGRKTIVVKTGEISVSPDYDFVINTADQTFRLPLLNGEEDFYGTGTETISIDTTGGVHRVKRNKNGFYSVAVNSSTPVSLICEVKGVYESAFTTDNKTARCSLFAKAGQEFLYAWNGSAANLASNSGMRFTPAVGNGSLYYYIGDTVQDASLINAGAVLGQLATKTNSVEAAAASMPSGRYINLTLGASGGTYTAPANGWFEFGSGETGVIQLRNDTKDIGMTSITQKYGARTFIPVEKGDTVSLQYTATPSTHKFIYAEGDQ